MLNSPFGAQCTRSLNGNSSFVLFSTDRYPLATVHFLRGQSYCGFVGGSAGASAAPFGLAIVERVSTLNFL